MKRRTKKKNKGCLLPFIIFFALLVLFGSGETNQNSDIQTNTSSIEKVVQTASVENKASSTAIKPASSPTPTPTPIPTPTPTPSPTPTPKPLLKKGAVGDAVVEIQLLLIEKNYLDGEADGKFGNATQSATKDFQFNNGLEETGVWDEKTWTVAQQRYCVSQRTVYKSKNGKVYHEYDTCSGMKTAQAMTLTKALRSGLSACDHCH